MMTKVVSCRFTSNKEYKDIPIKGSGDYISAGELKMAIVSSRYKAKKGADPRKNPNGLCYSTDLDFVVTNAETKEEYSESAALIPSGTCVLIRRVPGYSRGRWINTSPINLIPEAEAEAVQESSEINREDEKEQDLHDFGEDPFQLFQSTVFVTLSKEEEDLKIMELVNTPTLPPLPSTQTNNWNCRKRYRASRYVWRRNNNNNSVSISTNSGEKRQRTMTVMPSATGASSSSSSSCGSNGNESKKMVIPPELHCPMCKKVMEDVMFVTKCCCFRTYCKGCIRGRLMTANSCACGALDVGVDHLVPNVTIRKMIARLLAKIQSNCSSSSDSNTELGVYSSINNTVETN